MASAITPTTPPSGNKHGNWHGTLTWYQVPLESSPLLRPCVGSQNPYCSCYLGNQIPPGAEFCPSTVLWKALTKELQLTSQFPANCVNVFSLETSECWQVVAPHVLKNAANFHQVAIFHSKEQGSYGQQRRHQHTNRDCLGGNKSIQISGTWSCPTTTPACILLCIQTTVLRMPKVKAYQ